MTEAAEGQARTRALSPMMVVGLAVVAAGALYVALLNPDLGGDGFLVVRLVAVGILLVLVALVARSRLRRAKPRHVLARTPADAVPARACSSCLVINPASSAACSNCGHVFVEQT